MQRTKWPFGYRIKRARQGPVLQGFVGVSAHARGMIGTLSAQARQLTVGGKDSVALDVQREKHSLQSLLKLAENLVVSTVDAMPAGEKDAKGAGGRR